jgi:hypothetical protein
VNIERACVGMILNGPLIVPGPQVYHFIPGVEQSKSIAGHSRQWIDGSIRMVRSILSVDTFGLILIDIIDPSVKDFFYLMDSIDNRS